MQLLFLFVVTFCLFSESKSSPLRQDGRKEDLVIQCLVEVLTKVVSKPDGTSLQPECKDILQKQEQDEKRESNAREQEIIQELLKANDDKREEMDEERSQEEFPNYYKRHHLFTSKEKREYLDDERSQEEFPQKRHTKERREDDEDRSQEEFPAYEQKRHFFLASREKRDEPDYDRSQEDFPSYIYKRSYDKDMGTNKQLWKPTLDEGSDESEEDRRVWKPNYKNYNMKHIQKQGQFQSNNANLHHTLEISKRRSPEQEEEELIAQEINENKHHYGSQEEQKRHHSDVDEKEQEKEAELKYLTKKRNELEERLLKDGELYDKRNPWGYKGYYHPTWYRRDERNDDLLGPSQKLKELANALRYKMGLLSEKESTEEEKSDHQKALTPEELKELEKLASVEQRAQVN